MSIPTLSETVTLQSAMMGRDDELVAPLLETNDNCIAILVKIMFVVEQNGTEVFVPMGVTVAAAKKLLHDQEKF